MDDFLGFLRSNSEQAGFQMSCIVTSFWLEVSVTHSLPQPGFPAPDIGQEKFNSRLVVPT